MKLRAYAMKRVDGILFFPGCFHRNMVPTGLTKGRCRVGVNRCRIGCQSFSSKVSRRVGGQSLSSKGHSLSSKVQSLSSRGH